MYYANPYSHTHTHDSQASQARTDQYAPIGQIGQSQPTFYQLPSQYPYPSAAYHPSHPSLPLQPYNPGPPSAGFPSTAGSSEGVWQPLQQYPTALHPPSTTTPMETPLPSPLLPPTTTPTPMISRSRRAAASKAPTTIASATATHTRAPMADRTNTHTHALSHTTTRRRKPEPPTAQNVPYADVPIQLKGGRGSLLPCPPGAFLEVNDLLILHPPALSPTTPRQPVNQYSHAPAPEGYRSQYEMYTCRVCSKTYDGKNARSVARRHLQDKHGVPLALQQRRTRWDGEPDRPKTADAAREKTLKSKRNWAKRTRYVHRLERLHATFLEPFGPDGILAPCGTRLTAPSMRNTTRIRGKQYPRGMLSWEEMPAALQRSLQNPDEDLDEHDGDASSDQQQPKAKPAARAKRTTKKRPTASISTINTSTSTNFSLDSIDSPLPRPYSAGTNRTPISDARSRPIVGSLRQLGLNDIDAQGEADGYGEWDAPAHSATYVSDSALQAALAQHYEYGPSTSQQTGPGGERHYSHAPQGYESLAAAIENENGLGSAPLSPDVDVESLYTIEERPFVQEWAGPAPQPNWLSDAFQNQGSFSSIATSANNQRPNWESEDTDLEDVPQRMSDESKVEDENELETRAAESLLNLHSTPARPEDDLRPRDSTSNASNDDANQGEETESMFTNTTSNASGLLDPPEITPRPRPHRARSLIQPFAKSRPEAPSRSLSFTDDVFVVSPVPPTKKRRNTVASPSPLQKRRKETEPSPRMPLSLVRTSANLSNMASGNYATPVKPGRAVVPSSLSKMWLLSSPGNADAAERLGLVPGWTMGTPGLSGIVGADTPWKGRSGWMGVTRSGGSRSGSGSGSDKEREEAER